MTGDGTAAGSVFVAAGMSSLGVGGAINISGGGSAFIGGDVLIEGGGNVGGSDSGRGGDVIVQGGRSENPAAGGRITVKSSSGKEYLEVSDGSIGIHSGSQSGKISLTIPISNARDATSVIGLGITNTSNDMTTFGFRLQSTSSVNGSASSLLIASSPLQVTSLQYSSDVRIKQDIQSVDEDDILQRIKAVRIRSYGYTDEWRAVRGDVPNARVRGVIAQELAEVFPEYVSVIPEYSLEDKKFTIKDFHQVDKTSLILDLIAAMQAQGRRFSVASNSAEKSGDVSIMSASWSDTVAGSESTSSGNVIIKSGDAYLGSSGAVIFGSGSSNASAAGMVEIRAGSSGSGKGATVSVISGESVDVDASGGILSLRSGSGMGLGGDVTIASGSGNYGTGSMLLSTGDSESGSTGAVSIRSGRSSSGVGGDVSIRAGESKSSIGGDIAIEGGSLFLRGGGGFGGSAGSVLLEGGEAVGVGAAGGVTIRGGTSTSGVGSGGSLLLGGGDSIVGTADGLRVNVGWILTRRYGRVVATCRRL